jgi:hypothetical protein
MSIVTKSPVARSIPFDNSTNGFTSIEVQGAIEEVKVTASPGYSFGRSGTVVSGTWLLRPGEVPSNKTGIAVGLITPSIKKIQIGNENISTFTLEIYEHEGDEINLTLLTTVTITAARTATFTSSAAITSGRQIAVKLSSGSAKNVGVDLILSGSVT